MQHPSKKGVFVEKTVSGLRALPQPEVSPLHLAPAMASLTVQMEAYAFRELVAHLQWRKDVQNLGLSEGWLNFVETFKV